MEGKFRKRAETVWCPKPQGPRLDWRAMSRKDYEKYIQQEKTGIMLESLKPPYSRTRRFTGWTNMFNCDGCEFLEEFDLDNNGVFCTWKSQKVLNKRREKN